MSEWKRPKPPLPDINVEIIKAMIVLVPIIVFIMWMVVKHA